MFYPKLCCLTISHIRYLLAHSIAGAYGTCKGHKVIYITNNPDNPQTSQTRKECHRVNSRQGALLIPQIDKYNKLRRRLDQQLGEWYSHYNYEPPQYKMPYRSGRAMNYKCFENCPEGTNSIPPKYPITYKGKTYYSKNEVLAVIVTNNLGLMYKSEVPLRVNENTMYRIDGIIGCKAADFSMYIELMGMTDRPDYMHRNYQKIVDYSSAGLRQNNEILYIFVPNSYEFDFENLEMQIMMSIERSLPEPEGWCKEAS